MDGRLKLIKYGEGTEVILPNVSNLNVQRVENGWIVNVVDESNIPEMFVYEKDNLLALIDTIVSMFGHSVRPYE